MNSNFKLLVALAATSSILLSAPIATKALAIDLNEGKFIVKSETKSAGDKMIQGSYPKALSFPDNPTGGNPDNPTGGNDGTDDKEEAIEHSKIIQKVSAGKDFTVAVADDGSVYSFGHRDYIGQGESGNKFTPTIIKGLSQITQLSSGMEGTLALDSAGDVYAWGYNQSGSLALPSDSVYNTPVKVEGLSPIAKVSLGNHHAAAIAKNGDLYTWGLNANGQLGLGYKSDTPVKPTKVASLTSVKEVSVGNSSTIVLLEDGSVYTFGSNESKQIGNDEYADMVTPYLVMPAGSNIASVNAGYDSHFMVTTTGELYVFGSNIDGQLGLDNSYSRVGVPMINENVKNASKVLSSLSPGSRYTLVLTDAGDLWGFGDNDDLYLDSTPGELVSERGIIEIAGGTRHAVAVLPNGEMRALGQNIGGSLGNAFEDPDNDSGFQQITIP